MSVGLSDCHMESNASIQRSRVFEVFRVLRLDWTLRNISGYHLTRTSRNQKESDLCL
jgi:hypothetical protein